MLPAILTDDIITTHLKSSGKQLHPKKRRKLSEVDDNSTAGSYSNVDYSTLQRGHQYFMESYIPGRYVRFCCKEGQIWVRARCYRSQKKNDSMHYVNVALACESPHFVTRALCSCIAGKSRMCSHVVGVLKQLIHYALMKVQTVPDDLTCTQMQQTWHKPRPSQIEAEPVMNVSSRRASQTQSTPKRDPVVCTLFEARARAVQDYSEKQQHDLRAGLQQCQPKCAFSHTLRVVPEEFVTTQFGRVPKGSILSYQLCDYKKADVSKPKPTVPHNLPLLPLSALDTIPSVPSGITSNQQTYLHKLRVTLVEAHELEQSTQQQSASAKWRTSRVGRVTASRFGDVLLRQSAPSSSFLKSFLEAKEYSSLPVQLKHGRDNEIKARNAYIDHTKRNVRECGFVVNPSIPWLGASPDGLIFDPLNNSVGILEIKCTYTHRLYTVQEAAASSNFFASVVDGTVMLKRSNKYYYQVQGQMALAGVLWCDFMIYTFKNYTIERIQFDVEFWKSMQIRLTKFYFQYILPAASSDLANVH